MDSQNIKRRAKPAPQPGFLERYGPGILCVFVVALVVHDVFGAHGFIAMRRTQSEIDRVQKDIGRLNSENALLNDEVKALRSDPKLIEKIAREDLKRAKPGEIIITIPPLPSPAQQPSQAPPAKP